MNYAIIFAGGPLIQKWLWKPKALLTIGQETLIGRLVRQLKSKGIGPIVAGGTTEEVSPPRRSWSEAYVKQIYKLPCEVLADPFQTEWKQSWRTQQFLLRYVLEKDDLEKVFVIAGDYAFEDKLLYEILDYPTPCCLFMHRWKGKPYPGLIGTSQVLLLTKEVLLSFLKLMPLEENAVFLFGLHQDKLSKLGFHPNGFRGEDFSKGWFVEIGASPESLATANFLLVKEMNQRISILQNRLDKLSGKI